MRTKVPTSVLELLAIPGLRPPHALDLYRKLGIATVADLEAACRQDRLKSATGLVADFQAKMLEGIALMRRSHGQRLIHHAAEDLAGLEANLRRSHPELTRIVPAGDVRRGSELVSDLALVAETPTGSGIDILRVADRTSIWLTDRPRWGVALVLATGSDRHLDELRSVAERRGLHLDEHGLYRGDGLIQCPQEEASTQPSGFR
jgi:DNA polymerase (family 10)